MKEQNRRLEEEIKKTKQKEQEIQSLTRRINSLTVKKKKRKAPRKARSRK